MVTFVLVMPFFLLLPNFRLLPYEALTVGQQLVQEKKIHPRGKKKNQVNGKIKGVLNIL